MNSSDNIIETKTWTNSELITKQIPVINNRIISIDRCGGGLLQLVARDIHCYLTGNPQVSFFEHGSKYLWNDAFYKNHEPYKIRSDDFSISTITYLTGEIQYNHLDINVIYSPYYNQYNAPISKTHETSEIALLYKITDIDDLYSCVIGLAKNTGKYQTVLNIYTDLAYERRRHAIVAMNIYLL